MGHPLLPLAEPPRGRGDGPQRYSLFALGLLAVGLAGFAGFLAYRGLDLEAGIGAGLFVIAAAAGVAAFFSPCSFPLLLTLLARGARGASTGSRTRGALAFAVAFSVGAVAFLALLGALVGLGGRGLAASVTFTSVPGIGLRLVVGLGLIVLGLMQAEVIPGSFHGVARLLRPLSEAQARVRRRRPQAGAALFGFAYVLIGFG